MHTNIEQAVAHLKNGDRAEARKMLIGIVRRTPQNETAWLWLAKAMDTRQERIRVLDACLRYNPDCEIAQRGLDQLLQKTIPTATAASPAAKPRYPINAFLSLILVVTIVSAAAYFGLKFRANGMNAAGSASSLPSPVQKSISVQPFTLDDSRYEWLITPRASYQITARVLGRQGYRLTPGDLRARISPIDLALGWGPVSDPAVDEWIDWSQHGRWYYYHWEKESPIVGKEIGLNSANTHIIPANHDLEMILTQLRVNDIVYLEGYLVDIETQVGEETWYASTSLSRSDTGNGACEQLYVKRIVWNGQEYR